MPFWLAQSREGQYSEHVPRFDPRFWTVDFPRPAMASATTLGTDGLRVDCELHRTDSLIGLIWESVDRFDHPLLAYATDRNYSRTTLSFRWRSQGLIPLDAVNGPTLTIEGRDASGAARVCSHRRAVSSSSSNTALASAGEPCHTLGPRRWSITARIGVPAACICAMRCATSRRWRSPRSSWTWRGATAT